MLAQEAPPTGKDSEFLNAINSNALQVLQGAKLERSLAAAKAGERFQFERQGYFIADTKDCLPGSMVFNRTVTLKDSWAKSQKK